MSTNQATGGHDGAKDCRVCGLVAAGIRQFCPEHMGEMGGEEQSTHTRNLTRELVDMFCDREMAEIAKSPRPGWISMTERTPDRGKLVLLYSGHGPDCMTPYQGEYTLSIARWGDNRVLAGWPRHDEATHWLPIPKVPALEEALAR